MRFFSVAAVFLVGASSVFANDVEKRDDNTVVVPVHVTSVEIITASAQAAEQQTEVHTVIKYHTVSGGYKSHSISMPDLKPFTKKRKAKSTHAPKVKPTHTPKAHHTKHGRRDVTEIVHATVQTVETIQPAQEHQTKVHTERVTSKVEVTKTMTDKHHHHNKVTGLPALHAVKKARKHGKAKTAPAVHKEKRSLGAGWFA